MQNASILIAPASKCCECLTCNCPVEMNRALFKFHINFGTCWYIPCVGGSDSSWSNKLLMYCEHQQTRECPKKWIVQLGLKMSAPPVHPTTECCITLTCKCSFSRSLNNQGYNLAEYFCELLPMHEDWKFMCMGKTVWMGLQPASSGRSGRCFNF